MLELVVTLDLVMQSAKYKGMWWFQFCQGVLTYFSGHRVLGMINNCVILGEHCRESTEASKAIRVLRGTSSSSI